MGTGKSKPQNKTSHPNDNKRSTQKQNAQNHRQKSNQQRQPNGSTLQKPQWKQPSNAQLQKHSQPPRQQQQLVLAERNRTNKAECTVCGHEGHAAARCFHRHKTCMICFQTGHIRSVCKQKTHHPDSVYKPKSKSNTSRHYY